MSTRTLSRWALGSTVLLVMLGGYTRGSGSGYGCKDRWPLCENGLLGGLLPRLEYHMVVEWTHRWVAAIVGLLIILTAIAAWRSRPRNPRIVWPATAAIVVVGVQAWLGRLIVKGDLDRDLVSVHLTVSMLIVGLLVLVVVASGARSSAPADTKWRWMVIAAAATAYGVLLLGSTVHNLYFAGWPLQASGADPGSVESLCAAALHPSSRGRTRLRLPRVSSGASPTNWPPGTTPPHHIRGGICGKRGPRGRPCVH